jgi:hypothetical protein
MALEGSGTGSSSLCSKELVGAALAGLICVNKHNKQQKIVDIKWFEHMSLYGMRLAYIKGYDYGSLLSWCKSLSL